MAEIVPVPALMSLEGRAQMIAEECGRVEQAGNPNARRSHVAAHALAHLRAAMAQARNTEMQGE